MPEKLIACIVVSGSVATEGASIPAGSPCELPESEARRLAGLGVVTIGGKPFDTAARAKAERLRVEIPRDEADLAAKRAELAAAEAAGGL